MPHKGFYALLFGRRQELHTVKVGHIACYVQPVIMPVYHAGIHALTPCYPTNQ